MGTSRAGNDGSCLRFTSYFCNDLALARDVHTSIADRILEDRGNDNV
jgi:hypothetical protein